MNTDAIPVAVTEKTGFPADTEQLEEIVPITLAVGQDDDGPSVLPSTAIRLPVAVSGVSVSILMLIAVVFALEWAQSVVISLLLGILFACTLNPLVVWLERSGYRVFSVPASS